MITKDLVPTPCSTKSFVIMAEGWRGRRIGRRVPWLLGFLRSWQAVVTGDAYRGQRWAAVRAVRIVSALAGRPVSEEKGP